MSTTWLSLIVLRIISLRESLHSDYYTQTHLMVLSQSCVLNQNLGELQTGAFFASILAFSSCLKKLF